MLVVEHEPDVISVADHVVDMGPGAGRSGGTVVFEGGVEALKRSDTLTGKHFARHQPLKTQTRQPDGAIRIANASLHNLDDVTRQHPARRPDRGHRRRGLRQELADPRPPPAGRARGAS